MEKNTLIALVVVAVLGIAAAAVVVTINNDDNQDTVDSDAKSIAEAFETGYDGAFNNLKMSVSEDSTSKEAMVWVKNGVTSKYSPHENYVKFIVSDDAEGDYKAIESDYLAKEGTTAMGTPYSVTKINGDLDGGCGYLLSMGGMMPTSGMGGSGGGMPTFDSFYYAGYEDDVYIEAYFYLPFKTVDDGSITEFVNALHAAIEA